MITYEYECETCGLTFERRQSIRDEPLIKCPECGGKVFRRISGGSGFLVKGNSGKRMDKPSRSCSFEASGKTCCGREERCTNPPCDEQL